MLLINPCYVDVQPIEFLPVLTNTPDYTFKILVVGDSYVGKSSYIHRLCNNNFSQSYTTTIGEYCLVLATIPRTDA